MYSVSIHLILKWACSTAIQHGRENFGINKKKTKWTQTYILIFNWMKGTHSLCVDEMQKKSSQFLPFLLLSYNWIRMMKTSVICIIIPETYIAFESIFFGTICLIWPHRFSSSNSLVHYVLLFVVRPIAQNRHSLFRVVWWRRWGFNDICIC